MKVVLCLQYLEHGNSDDHLQVFYKDSLYLQADVIGIGQAETQFKSCSQDKMNYFSAKSQYLSGYYYVIYFTAELYLIITIIPVVVQPLSKVHGFLHGPPSIGTKIRTSQVNK